MTVYTDFADIPRGKYGAILADPPWSYSCWNAPHHHGTAESHYSTMPPDEIASLAVQAVARADSALFLWATWPCLPDAMAVIEAWGFEYKTAAFVWMKQYSEGGRLCMGLGHTTRGNSEPVLLGKRGSPQRKDAGISQVIVAPRREHSRKPDVLYELIEALVDGPYLELFARQERPGWDSFGNEVGKFAPEPRQESLALEGAAK